MRAQEELAKDKELITRFFASHEFVPTDITEPVKAYRDMLLRNYDGPSGSMHFGRVEGRIGGYKISIVWTAERAEVVGLFYSGMDGLYYAGNVDVMSYRDFGEKIMKGDGLELQNYLRTLRDKFIEAYWPQRIHSGLSKTGINRFKEQHPQP